jgi:hypothetical protein
MNINKQVEHLLREEFKDSISSLIWQEEDGTYRVFGHYSIVPEKPCFKVFCSATEIGLFTTSRAALAWCIADKHKLFNLARDILTLDTKLGALTRDIFVRAGSADKSPKPDFREIVGTKLETKLIRKKEVEQSLAKCINFAKYYEQQGLNNETPRISRNPNNKSNRKGV